MVAYTVDGEHSIAPAISSVQPDNGVTLQAVPTVSAVFAQDMNSSSISSSTFTVKDSDNNPITGIVSYNNKTATFTPFLALPSGIYTATISADVRDPSGVSLAGDYTWSFTVGLFFPASLVWPASSYPVAVATGDVNGDGRDDVVMVTTTLNGNQDDDYKLFVFLQNASGGLDAPMKYAASTPTRAPSTVAIGDVNHDGKNDVIVGGWDLKGFLENGSGTLDPPVTYASRYSGLIRVADVNNDGLMDIVVIGQESQSSIRTLAVH